MVRDTTKGSRLPGSTVPGMGEGRESSGVREVLSCLLAGTLIVVAGIWLAARTTSESIEGSASRPLGPTEKQLAILRLAPLIEHATVDELQSVEKLDTNFREACFWLATSRREIHLKLIREAQRFNGQQGTARAGLVEVALLRGIETLRSLGSLENPRQILVGQRTPIRRGPWRGSEAVLVSRLPIGLFPEVAFTMFNREFVPLKLWHEREQAPPLKLNPNQRATVRKWVELGLLPRRALERARGRKTDTAGLKGEGPVGAEGCGPRKKGRSEDRPFLP